MPLGPHQLLRFTGPAELSTLRPASVVTHRVTPSIAKDLVLRPLLVDAPGDRKTSPRPRSPCRRSLVTTSSGDSKWFKTGWLLASALKWVRAVCVLNESSSDCSTLHTTHWQLFCLFIGCHS